MATDMYLDSYFPSPNLAWGAKGARDISKSNGAQSKRENKKLSFKGEGSKLGHTPPFLSFWIQLFDNMLPPWILLMAY